MRVTPYLFTTAAAIAASAGAAALAHAEHPLSTTGRVLAGPRLARTGDVLVAAWIEDPKTLVLARLDASGHATERQELALPEQDAAIIDLAPVVRADGSMSVFLLEQGVRRLGQDVPLKRVIVRHIEQPSEHALAQREERPLGQREERPLVQVVAEAPDDGSGRAPAAIVAAGLYTASRWPAVVWRRDGGDAPEAELAIARPDEVTSSEILGDSRVATAVAWRDDGGALVAASDAGRPVVMETAAEAQIDVPTPAALTGLVVSGEGDWIAAGVDAGRRLFVVGGAAHRAAQSYFHAVAPLVDAPADLADVGSIIGAPRLVRIGTGTAVLWTARVGTVDQVRLRGLDGDGRAGRGSLVALKCEEGERALALDAAGVGGNVVVVALCAADGRADVRGAVVRCDGRTSEACGIGPPATRPMGAARAAYRSYFGSLFPL